MPKKNVVIYRLTEALSLAKDLEKAVDWHSENALLMSGEKVDDAGQLVFEIQKALEEYEAEKGQPHA